MKQKSYHTAAQVEELNEAFIVDTDEYTNSNNDYFLDF